MASALELRDKHKSHLHSLLRIKKRNGDKIVDGLQDEIEIALAVMEQEDVSWVEKIAGVKAL